MDRIAVISDIHGNIPALSAVIDDINKRGISKIICLGDIVGKGPQSDLAIDIIREKCNVVIKGNWDYLVSQKAEKEIFIWHKDQIGDERVKYLINLPMYEEFYMSGRLVRLFHAAPQDVFDRVPSDTTTEEKSRLFRSPEKGKKDSDMVGYGDIHEAYIKNFDQKTIFNAGSVGNPLEITQASYVILEGEYGSEVLSSISVSFVRLPYDIQKSIEIAQNSGMPEIKEYASELTTAIYRGSK